MNLLHLHYFYTVAKESGYTNASKVLRIQQPAISRMVGILEEDFGFKLFEKIGRHVQLTPKGLEVFEHCKKIFGSVEDLKQSLGRISGECKGPIKLAASEPIASHFIPKVMGGYLHRFPNVYPSVFSGPASMLFERILNGEIDLGLFFHIPELPEKLEIIEKKNVRYHLVIHKDFKKRKEVIETFFGSREIDDTSTRKFPTLERLRKDYPRAQIKISSNNLTAHRQMVLQGLGVSVLPDFLIADDLKNQLLVDLLPKESLFFQMKFIQRKTAVLSNSAAEWIKSCLEELS